MADTRRRQGVLHALGRARWFHRLVHLTGLYAAANWLLGRIPRRRRLPRSGCVLRIRSVAGLALAEEMLQDGAYRSLAGFGPFTTFIDLGCNVGWFPCLLDEYGGDERLTGIAIDADPDMVREAEWHLETNKITGRCIFGAVGVPGHDSESVAFHVNPANTSSSLTPFSGVHPFPVKGRVRVIAVPVVRVADAWEAYLPDRFVDVMKVDIEGAEFDFFRVEGDFIRRKVRFLICEWHSWHGDLAELRATTAPLGLELVEVCQQDENGGVALFRNPYVPLTFHDRRPGVQPP